MEDTQRHNIDVEFRPVELSALNDHDRLEIYLDLVDS